MDNELLKHLQLLLKNAPERNPDPGFAIPYKHPQDPGGVDPKSEVPKPQVNEQRFREASNEYADAANDYRKERDNPWFIGDWAKKEDAIYDPDIHQYEPRLLFDGQKERMTEKLDKLQSKELATSIALGFMPDKRKEYQKRNEYYGKLTDLLRAEREKKGK